MQTEKTIRLIWIQERKQFVSKFNIAKAWYYTDKILNCLIRFMAQRQFYYKIGTHLRLNQTGKLSLSLPSAIEILPNDG